MNKIALLIIYLLLTVSCNQHAMKNEQSLTNSITVGSTLILNQEIKIEANLGRTFFQFGKITPEKDINIYYPHCSITVNTIRSQTYTISPTSFQIMKVINDEEYAQGYMLFADNSLKLASDGPLITGLVSYYYLQSADEPDVRTLECIQWDSLYENNFLSISETRKSLGSIFTLHLNEKN